MMTRDLHHLAAAYALDALDADERRAFEAHYPSCEVCSAEVVDFRETAASLAETTVTRPPTGLKDRIMADVAATRQISPLLSDTVVDLAERRRRPLARAGMLAAAAAVVVAVVGFASGWLDNGSGVDEFEQLAAAPDAVVTQLDGEAGMISVVWSAERDQAAVVASGLADLSADEVYALWFLTPDGVAPAGLFSTTDGDVDKVLDVADIDGLGWGVTIEPAGGSDQPTGEVIYVAEF